MPPGALPSCSPSAATARLKVTVYNNDQLAGGDMTKGLELLTSGSVDFDVHSTSIISSLAPSAMVATLPWLFADYQAAEDCFFGTGGEYMNKILGESGVTYLGAVHNGFKLMTNSKHPIQNPEDLQGLKIRIPGGDFFMDFYSAYGASPQAMSWSEVFTALQQGTIDGHDNSISTIVSNNVQEIQPYMTVSPPHLRGLHLHGQHRQLHLQAERGGPGPRPRVRRGRLQGGQRPNRGRRGRAHPEVHRRERALSSTTSPRIDVEEWRSVITDLIEEYKGIYGEEACTASASSKP